MEFEWDYKKAQSNADKHGVSFEEASELFSDVLSSTVSDPDHSEFEDRLIILENRKVIDIWSPLLQSEMIKYG